MNRRDALEVFVRYRGDAPAVTGPSFGGRILHELDHRPETIYNMELAYPTPMCMGMALALPEQRVFAIEGDGSMLAGLPSLTTVAHYAPKNLVILVLDNRAYASTGGQPTTSVVTADIVAIAQGAGIGSAVRARTVEELDAALRNAVETDGPHLVLAEIEHEDVRTAGRSQAYPFDIVESVVTFRRALENRGLVPTIWAV